MKCINHEVCGGEVALDDRNTYWQAEVAIRHREEGGPNRRALTETGRGWCLDCSLRLEHHMPITGQKALF